MTVDEFILKYCRTCGSQRCGGARDVPFRDACEHYQKEEALMNKGDQSDELYGGCRPNAGCRDE